MFIIFLFFFVLRDMYFSRALLFKFDFGIRWYSLLYVYKAVDRIIVVHPMLPITIIRIISFLANILFCYFSIYLKILLKVHYKAK